MQEIPLAGGSVNSHQTFSVQCGDNMLDFELDYITYVDTPYWSMTVSRDGTDIIVGASLVAGAYIKSRSYYGFGYFVFVGDEATLDNLGINNHLCWIPE